MSNTKNSAIAKIIIDELSPVIQQTENIVQELKSLNVDLKKDLTTYQAITDNKSLPTLATKQDLHQEIMLLESRLRSALQYNEHESDYAGQNKYKKIVFLVVLIALLLLGTIFYFRYHSVMDDAKFGQQFRSIYPFLDQQTKDNIKDAIKKASA